MIHRNAMKFSSYRSWSSHISDSTSTSTSSPTWSGIRGQTSHYIEKYFNYGAMRAAHYIGKNPPSKKWVEGAVADFLFNFESTVIIILGIGVVVSLTTNDVMAFSLSAALFIDAYMVNYLLKLVFCSPGPQGLNDLYGYELPNYPSEQMGVLVSFGLLVGLHANNTGGLLNKVWMTMLLGAYLFAPVFRNVAYPHQVLTGFSCGVFVGTAIYFASVLFYTWIASNHTFRRIIKTLGLRNEYAISAASQMRYGL